MRAAHLFGDFGQPLHAACEVSQIECAGGNSEPAAMQRTPGSNPELCMRTIPAPAAAISRVALSVSTRKFTSRFSFKFLP
jgi:hypothetical protein